MRPRDIYNIVSIVFLLLSLTICLISVAWMTDSIAVPESIAPPTEVPLPTAQPTLVPMTSTPTPGQPGLATAPPELPSPGSTPTPEAETTDS